VSIEDYEPVADRLVRFWAAHPDGRIVNELITFEGDRCIVKSSIYFHKDDSHPVAVDYAEEIRGSSNVNRTSHIENCSTSATGRSLSLCGFSSATDGSGAGWAKKPSREEMQKVTRMGEVTKTQPANVLTEAQERAIRAICKSMGRTVPTGLQSFTKSQASRYIEMLKGGENPDAQNDNTDAEEPF
jgi:hypothetical protein